MIIFINSSINKSSPVTFNETPSLHFLDLSNCYSLKEGFQLEYLDASVHPSGNAHP